MSLKVENRLLQYKKKGLYRERNLLEKIGVGARRWYKNKYLLSFNSNDYLGLSQHFAVKKAFKEAVNQYGVGSGSSCLLGAYSCAHQELEQDLAKFLGYPRTLVCSTGYMANISALSSLLRKKDTLFSDKLNHASLIDGAKLSAAVFMRYPHSNMLALEEQLAQSTAERKFIISDGVFSMDGDIALLPYLIQKAEKYSATLLIDDAHGIGVLGKRGAGISDYFSLKPPILTGGFGKAFGCFGGFIAASEALIEYMVQFARTYMYTTALPIAMVKAAHASLILLQTEGWRREKLFTLIAYFKRKAQQLRLPIVVSATPIQPLLIGSVHQTTLMAQYLYRHGFLVHAIRPPTVPRCSSRLRISLNVQHSEAEIDHLLECIAMGIKLLYIN